MAIRKAKSRPPCVDLAPSAFVTRHKPARGQQKNTDASQLLGSARTRHSDMPAGAVRRSPSKPARPDSHHAGKLTATALLVAGAVVWTTGSSESFGPSESNVPELATVTAPAFFFDDRADALESSGASAPTYNTLVVTNSAAADSTNANGTQIASRSSTTDETVKTSEQPELLAMLTNPAISQPSLGTAADDKKPTPAPSTDSSEDLAATVIDNSTSSSEPQTTAPLIEGLPVTPQMSADSPVTKQISVAAGQTLSGILNRNGLKAEQMRQLMTDEVVEQHLSNIAVGQLLELTQDSNGEFTGLTTRAGDDTRINIDLTSNGFDVTAIDLPIERRRTVSSGQIDQSLYVAAEQAELKRSTIMELANIFQWELDFARDIRQGDRFSLVYERLYRENEYIGDGDILAAEFVRGGKVYKAIRFTTDDGKASYYSPNGEPKRRAFMRHPVDLDTMRITSKFNPARLHPVLHQIRAHRGVDYGSPYGSPIYATADGKVIFSGSKNAYGKTVVLKHGEKFSTLYAHMSRISDKSSVGSRVNQGDVIGYVGNTGRVTGTHLHYEFRVRGMQIDPLKVELPAAEPLDKKYHASLQEIAYEMSVLMATSPDNAGDQVAIAPDLDADLDTAE